MNRREEIVRAVARAAEVHTRFVSPLTEVPSRTSFDVVGAVVALGVPLLFRPLAGLWGAALLVDRDLRGILVTTKVDHHVQRFTLAHELGHLLLEHRTSIDQTVSFAGRYGADSIPTQEIAADAFASELLAPKLFMARSAQRHGWTRAALAEPGNVYQLSLRLGMSFQATCWALATHGALTREQAEAMQGRTVRDLKRSIAPRELITNSWADVWRLTPSDTGTLIEAGPEDLFAVQVSDDAGGGYLWRLVDAAHTVQVVGESELAPPDDGSYGGPSARTIYLRVDSPGQHKLVFEHARPWSGATIGTIMIGVENYGKEGGGWPRLLREAALAGET